MLSVVEREQINLPNGDFRTSESIEVSAGNAGVANELSQALAGFGQTTTVVSQPSPSCSHLIITEGLTEGEPAEFHARVLEQAKRLARLDHSSVSAITLLQHTHAPSRAWLSGLPGLGRTLAKELRGTFVQTLNLEGAALATTPQLDAACRAILGRPGHGDMTIAPDGTARGPRLVTQKSLTPSPLPITPDDTFIATGGGQGITADCTRALAEKSGAHVFLLGRTKPIAWPQWLDPDLSEKDVRGVLAHNQLKTGTKPDLSSIAQMSRALVASRTIARTLEAIRASGAGADYLCADITDEKAVASAVGHIIALRGSVTGLIHGAGRLADRDLGKMTAADVETVFGPKVDGLRLLLGRLDPSNLKHVALFSSAAAQFGNPGQANYAMANEVLNHLAYDLKARFPDMSVTSFNWGPWEGGMVSPALKAAFRARGIKTLDTKMGANLFADVMMSDLNATEVCIGEI